MNKLILPGLTAALAFVSLSASAAEPQNGSGETNGYKLVWQDLFDNGRLDTELRWNIEVNGDGGGNSELQYYTDKADNVHVGDDGQGNGCLILTARRESYRGKNFTSGRINSLGNTFFTHGKVEASIKMPATYQGLWPAFWMMGNDHPQVGWPSCGETDILEMGHSNGIKNGVSDRFYNGAAHWGPKWDKHYQYAKDKTHEYSLQDGQFHLYTCIWDENFISMYVDLDKYPDQEPYYRIDISRVDMSDETCAGNYFHKDNFIIFNLAVGGNFPGIWDANGITALNNENGNEASMYVNYVKIYQKGADNENFFAATEGDKPGTDPVPPPTPPVTDITEGFVKSFSDLHGPGTYYAVSMSDNSIANLRAAGNTVVDVRAGTDNCALNIWEGTFSEGSNMMAAPGWDASANDNSYISLTVSNSLGWSGAGWFLNEPVSASFSDRSRFHAAYATTGEAPASLGFSLWHDNRDGDTRTSARFCVGSETLSDAGETLRQASTSPITKEWQALDITLGELQGLYPDFRIPSQLNGNFFVPLGGGVAGRNIALHNVFLYTPAPTAIENVGADTDADAPVEYYNLQGVRVENPAGGLFIRRQGNKVEKVIL